MVLPQMLHESIVGQQASPSQAFQFFPRQHKLVSEQPSNTPLSSGVKTNCVLVRVEQLIATLAVHEILFQQSRSRGPTERCAPWRELSTRLSAL